MREGENGISLRPCPTLTPLPRTFNLGFQNLFEVLIFPRLFEAKTLPISRVDPSRSFVLMVDEIWFPVIIHVHVPALR